MRAVQRKHRARNRKNLAENVVVSQVALLLENGQRLILIFRVKRLLVVVVEIHRVLNRRDFRRRESVTPLRFCPFVHFRPVLKIEIVARLHTFFRRLE